jgi:tetratricopeptide (TPR) repeat protein
MRSSTTSDESRVSSSETPGTDSGISAAANSDPLWLRVSPHNYFAAIFVGTFLTAFLLYLELDKAAMAVFVFSWVVLPSLAFRDRVTFDGKRIRREGDLTRLWSWLTMSRKSLKVSDIEQAETLAIRVLKRGGNIRYRYVTVFRGKGVSISIASGGDAFRRIVRSILALLPENALDTRSIELRDHLVDPKEALMRAEFSRIPAPDVLETQIRPHMRRKSRDLLSKPITDATETEAEDLRSLANELRLGGYLLQALEAFRRALVLNPRDGRLLFEFARCLHSFSGVERDKKMERRALAALRLSERRGRDDQNLLVRVGEWYFQIGEWKRAAAAFRSVLDTAGANFRTAVGLAEIALREGKIAHVIHHFSSAVSTADTRSLRRWSSNEANYFSNLHSDEEYMELEVSRINMLGTLETSRRSALRIAIFAFPLIATGLIFEDSLVTNIGWAVSVIALATWVGIIVGAKMFERRIPYELIENEESE